MKVMPIVGFMAGFLALGACGGAAPGGTTPARHVFIQGPHIERGTELVVRLDRALDLSSSAAGDTFEASLDADAHTPRGDVLVRAGAHVHGRIVWGSRTGRIYLRDATVTSPVGPLALRGALRFENRQDTSDGDDDEPVARPATIPDPVRGAEPLARDQRATSTARPAARLPIGTVVRVVLTQPVLVPGVSVVGE